MNQQCYKNGACIECGCDTTQLQMCNKPCKGLEYPPMVGIDDWDDFINYNGRIKNKKYLWKYSKEENSITLYKNTERGYVQIYPTSI